ncbi:hypothetical protein AGMMS49942_01710 [Spirochaetia bacterium]|nr:hypothetical protein AGMMS49942_01710 [Spirochaetia bacterium]
MTTTQVQSEAPMTYEQIRAMFQDIGRSQKETDRILQETYRIVQETTQSQKETDRQIQETDRILQELGQETDRRIKEVAQHLGGMTQSDGDLAEELFFTSLESKMTFAGQHYDFIDRNFKRKLGALEGEYDIVLHNAASVGIVEVKSKAKTEHLEKLVTKKLPDFRTLFPEYRDYPIYLGIGSMSFDKKVLQRAQELGIGILRQKGDTIEADTGAVRAYR